MAPHRQCREPLIDKPSSFETGRFRELLNQRLGWQFEEAKLAGLATTLAARAAAYRLPCASYLDRLARARLPDEWAALARELTITETYFLRYADQFHAMVQQALPQCLAARGADAPVQLLSIGCASGEEPYSLAIAVREGLPEASARVHILAADINPAMLERARDARYSAWALRDLPEALRVRWFRADGACHHLDPEIVGAVDFEVRNLALDDPGLWQAGRFDIVFCRNLLMYFSFEQAQAAVARIAQALRPGGYLFLGHAETLRGLSSEFQVCHHGDAFYYRKDSRSLPTPVAARPPPLPPSNACWMETIRVASARIEVLSGLAAAGAPAPVPGPDLGAVHGFLQQERYGQALAQLDLLPAHQGADPDVLLLRAIALCHRGALDQAQTACLALLRDDECNAGARYVLALCCEARGELAQAREQDQIACHLDPDFAMPRLHLGLLARRLGEPAKAARELKRAAGLLRRENAARLLLFGGGFQREALIALCRSGTGGP